MKKTIDRIHRIFQDSQDFKNLNRIRKPNFDFSAFILSILKNPVHPVYLILFSLFLSVAVRAQEIRVPANGFDFSLKVGTLPPATAIAYDPGGKVLAVGGYRNVILWDTAAGKPLTCLNGLSGGVQALSFRSDASLLAIAGGVPGVRGEVRIYDLKAAKFLPTLLTGHTDVVACVAWNKSGTQLATGSHDHTARIWEWPSGKEVQNLKDAADTVTCVCFAPDEKSLYTTSLDHSLRRYDVATGKIIRAYSGHEDGILALAVNAKGDKVVTAGSDTRLRWWNAETGENVRDAYGHNGTVLALGFTADGKHLLSTAADGSVRLCDADGNVQRGLDGFHDWVYGFAVTPDGKLTAGAGADGRVRLWETENGKLRLTLLAVPMGEKSAGVNWLAVTPEGYYDASADWAKLLRPLVSGKPDTAVHLVSFLPTLQQSPMLLKAWQGGALDAPKLPAPPSVVTPSPVKK